MRRLLWYGNSSGSDRNPNSSDNPVCLSVQLYGTYCQQKSPFVMKKYETELKQYYFKKERYKEHKAKIFVIVKGQCTLNMKNIVESLQGYDLVEANDDVIKLLNGLKELTFKTQEVQYGYWKICQTVRRVLTMRQQDNQPLAEYYKRSTSCVDVAESQWEP
jgi:hypothetical protein